MLYRFKCIYGRVYIYCPRFGGVISPDPHTSHWECCILFGIVFSHPAILLLQKFSLDVYELWSWLLYRVVVGNWTWWRIAERWKQEDTSFIELLGERVILNWNIEYIATTIDESSKFPVFICGMPALRELLLCSPEEPVRIFLPDRSCSVILSSQVICAMWVLSCTLGSWVSRDLV